MAKKAVSVTLDADNLVWLRGQASTRSVSEVLDDLVSDARHSGKVADSAVRRVRATIDLPADDPELAQADAYVRSLFERPAPRPWAVKETPPPSATGRRARKRKPRA